MYRLSGTPLSRPRILKPELPIERFAGSSVATGIPIESNTAGNARHTLSTEKAIVCTFDGSFPVIVRLAPPAETVRDAGADAALEPELAQAASDVSNSNNEARRIRISRRECR